MENTVTISLNEYLELKEFQDKILKGEVYKIVSYIPMLGTSFYSIPFAPKAYTEFIPLKESLKEATKINIDLHEKIQTLEKEIEKSNKRKSFFGKIKYLFNFKN